MIVLKKIVPKLNMTIVDILSGTKNGINKTFSTSSSYKSGNIVVTYNGQQLHAPDDFTETSSSSITFVYIAPHSDDSITATYQLA